MDWKALCADVAQWAEAHREEFIEDVSAVCRIPSISRNTPDVINAPFGAACRQMLDKALEMSAAYGFETRNYDNFCGSAVYGNNPDNDSIGIVAHMDVVTEDMCQLASKAGGWTHPPFDPVLSEDGKYLFGRGTCDNKSCGIMALYAMRYLKEHDIKLKNNVMLVYGMNEEIGMRDMPEFLKREKPSKIFLVPDSKYPVCISESGNTRYGLESARLEDSNLVDLWSGISNDDWCDPTVSVPSNEAWAVLSGVSLAVARQATRFYDHTRVETTEDGNVKIIVEKDEKTTATARLCQVLAKCGLVKDPKTMEVINWLNWYTSDTTGAHMGIACDDGPSAPLSVRFNYLRMADKKIVLYTSVLWPPLADKEKINTRLEETLAASPMEICRHRRLDGFYIDPKDPRVEKLARVAKDVLGREDIPYLTEGGTYAQSLPNAIPYGATVPDRVRLFGMVKGGAHQADEYCDIPNLLINMQIYVRALIELDEMYSK